VSDLLTRSSKRSPGWGMRSEPPVGWRLVLVGELIDRRQLIVNDGYRAKNIELGDEGLPFARAGNVRDGFHLADADRLSSKNVRRAGAKVSESDDVVFTSKGTVGRFAFVRGDTPRFAYSPQLCFWRVVDRSSIDPGFLFAWIRGPQCAHQFKGLKGQTDMADYISLRDQRTIVMLLPPIEEQKRIASVLSALDDKIDSNRRLASLLEDNVAALFRARFVDFVGVEDFEESEIGPIPRGWATGSLASLARFINGKAFTKDANAKGRPILRIKELNAGVRDDTLRTDMTAAEEHLARHHDILFAWSGSLAVYRWSGPESLINQHIFKVIPEGYPPWFVYQWVRRHMPEFEAIARDKATTMGHIQRRHLSEARVTLPDSDALARVSDLLEPLDQWQGILASEIASLAATRDALLPKLISGEIRVPDTTDSEEVIGAAVEQLAGAKA
jgi:type I restriction enzyme S subunit